MINIEKALELALQALKEKVERENPKPLTLEELRERVGKPVWAVDVVEMADIKFKEDPLWIVVCDIRGDMVCATSLDGYIKGFYEFYDHEPKGV